MNEEQLGSLVDAVDLGSLSAAARKNFLSTPSFAHRINVLEDEVGCRLLTRTARGVCPTEAGECLYDAAKRALATLADGKERARAAARKGDGTAMPGGRVSVGIWWRAEDYMVHAADEVSRDLGVHVDFIETDYNHAAEGLARRLFDLFPVCRAHSFDRLGFRFLPLGTSRMYCAFAPSSPLAECETVSMEMLEDVTVYAGSDYRDFVELGDAADLFARDNVVKESIFAEQLVMSCLQGNAVSFFGGSALAKVSPPLELRPMDWPELTFGLYGTPAAWEKPAVREFAEACERACRG